MFKKWQPKKWRYEEMTMIEMTDYELSQVVGAGGLFLTNAFGFVIDENTTNVELRNMINNKLQNLKNPTDILNVYITMAKVLNDEQVNTFTKLIVEQLFKNGMKEVQDLCKIAGLTMTVKNYNVQVDGKFKVEIR
jgi:hypothetical protein